ncbi:C40 family peptidase [Herbiconiux sp. L3-i23]|uniref:C40 family peptidase n=1 Tax=Herbiconiux sp. L3-i23 TaxID=2905871 RepID=UPI00206850A9|nr:C40 family peptidase [Herbiconiux sp. L3-i23]BDI23979.1 glycoside hydrolase [Herbiconiux sp. L3-i23]
MLGKRKTALRPEVAISALVIGSVTAAVGVSTAVAAPDYPTWDDVQNAKNDETATAAKIAELTGLLDGLQANAAAAARTQQIAAEKYAIAKDQLDSAAKREKDLASKAADADEKAKVSKMRAGLLAAHLARNSGSDFGLDLALNGSDADDLLYQLGTMTKLSAQSQGIYDDAIADQKEATSLGSQAQIATKQRAALADDAQKALDAANAASSAASAALAEQESRQSELYAQLASLKNTTASTEAAYQQGLTAEKEQQSGPPAPPSAPPITPPGATQPPPVAPPVVDKVATAIAFARDQIGEYYLLGGAGPDRWDCSGLTLKSYAAAGVGIGTHSATNQYNTARNRGQLVPYSQVQPGDLIFYSSDGSDMYHVTMYTGGGRMIEAPYEGVPVREVAVRSYERVAYVARPTA